MAKKPNRKVDQLLDSLLEDKQPAEILGDEGVLAELTKRLFGARPFAASTAASFVSYSSRNSSCSRLITQRD